MSIEYSKFEFFSAAFLLFYLRWMHFSRLPYLPEIDALKEDLSIINDTFRHLHLNQSSEKNYVEAYKYAFSRKGNFFIRDDVDSNLFV